MHAKGFVSWLYQDYLYLFAFKKLVITSLQYHCTVHEFSLSFLMSPVFGSLRNHLVKTSRMNDFYFQVAGFVLSVLSR